MNVLDDIVSIGCCSYPCLGQTTLLLEIRSPNQTKAINLLSILIISLISIFKFNEIIEKTQKQVIGCPKLKKKNSLVTNCSLGIVKHISDGSFLVLEN